MPVTIQDPAAVTQQAAALGFRLTDDGACYWLAWRHLCQPCVELGDVLEALEPGSAWRRLVARVQGEMK